jgi:hypothetical protein
MSNTLSITHILTRDDPDGQPWPPADDVMWVVVRSANGFTLWRCISITPSEPPPADARSFSGGTQLKGK